MNIDYKVKFISSSEYHATSTNPEIWMEASFIKQYNFHAESSSS